MGGELIDQLGKQLEDWTMPFDLFIRDIPNIGDSFKIPAGWLEGAEFPFPKEAVREISSPGYRDRYAIISLGELRALPVVANASEDHEDGPGEFKRLMKKREDHTPLVLHWEEWESGMG
jgi:hypothetical protein